VSPSETNPVLDIVRRDKSAPKAFRKNMDQKQLKTFLNNDNMMKTTRNHRSGAPWEFNSFKENLTSRKSSTHKESFSSFNSDKSNKKKPVVASH